MNSNLYKQFYIDVSDAWHGFSVELIDFDKEVIEQLVEYKTGHLSTLKKDLETVKNDLTDYNKNLLEQIDAIEKRHSENIESLKTSHQKEIEIIKKESEDKINALLSLLVKCTMKVENWNKDELFNILVKQEELLLEKRINELIK